MRLGSIHIPGRAVRGVISALLLLATGLAAGCNKSDETPVASAPPDSPAKPVVPAGALELKFVYGSEKKAWIDDVTADFNKALKKIGDGRQIFVTTEPLGSGETIDALISGESQAHLVSPASAAFVTLGNAKWRSTHGSDLIGPTENLVISPVVIAMWKPMAEALGWPRKPVGWKQILDLAQDPKGWATYNHPQWGSFRFGHTHPEYSNSGLISVLAEVYAGSGKRRGLTLEDLGKPEVAGELSGIEQAVVHYGKSTGFFADKMFAGGPSYLSAAVLYESSVIESYNQQPATEFPIVAVYPSEGTFWSDHPVGVVQREWVTDAHREAAKIYVDFLREQPQQRKAMQYGFRPGDTAVGLGAPIDAAHGVNPDEPKNTLEVPPAAVVDGAISLWRKNKKHANIVLVLDTSGSMNEDNKMTNARAGAAELIGMLDDDDTLSLLPFSSRLNWAGQGLSMKTDRAAALATVNSLTADGETALFDATAAARQYLLDHPDPKRISAVVVLTDGEDSKRGTPLNLLLSSIKGDWERVADPDLHHRLRPRRGKGGPEDDQRSDQSEVVRWPAGEHQDGLPGDRDVLLIRSPDDRLDDLEVCHVSNAQQHEL